MASDFNRLSVLGTVCTTPEIRQSHLGKDMARFAVVTTESWRDQSGTARKKAEIHYVVVFNDFLVSLTRRSVRRGSRVLVEGRFERRIWDENGAAHEACEIVLGLVRSVLLVLDSDADAAALADLPEGPPGLVSPVMPGW